MKCTAKSKCPHCSNIVKIITEIEGGKLTKFYMTVVMCNKCKNYFNAEYAL